MIMKKLVALLIAMLTILAVAVPAMAYTQTSVSGVRYIYASNGNPVNVRTGPGKNYNLAKCGTLPVGTKVNLVAKSTTNGTDWYKIVAANDSSKNGWVMGKFLSTTASGSGSGDACLLRLPDRLWPDGGGGRPDVSGGVRGGGPGHL